MAVGCQIVVRMPTHLKLFSQAETKTVNGA